MRNGLFIIGIASAFIAGGLAAYGYHQATKEVQVVVAKNKIPGGVPIVLSDLTTIPINETTAKEMHCYISEKALVGQYLNTSVPAGIPIVRAMADVSSDPQALINAYAKAHNVSGLGLEIDVKGSLLSEIQSGGSVMLFVQPPALAQSPTGMNISPYHLVVPVIQVNVGGSGTSLVVFLNNTYLGTSANQADVLNSLLKGQVMVAPYSSNLPESAMVYVPGVVSTGTASVLTTSSKQGGNSGS